MVTRPLSLTVTTWFRHIDCVSLELGSVTRGRMPLQAANTSPLLTVQKKKVTKISQELCICIHFPPSYGLCSITSKQCEKRHCPSLYQYCCLTQNKAQERQTCLSHWLRIRQKREILELIHHETQLSESPISSENPQSRTEIPPQTVPSAAPSLILLASVGRAVLTWHFRNQNKVCSYDICF